MKPFGCGRSLATIAGTVAVLAGVFGCDSGLRVRGGSGGTSGTAGGAGTAGAGAVGGSTASGGLGGNGAGAGGGAGTIGGVVAVGGSGAGGGGGGTVARFGCGGGSMARSCVSGSEYCAAAYANGAALLAECRPYPSGCFTCGCAKADALATIRNINACNNVTAQNRMCSGGLGDADSSATLLIVCMVP